METSLDSQIDALLSDAAAPESAEVREPVSSAAADAEAAVASIEKQVESLVDQFVEQSATTAESATTVPVAAASPPAPEVVAVTRRAAADVPTNPSPESIGELDDQLARLTDELLAAPAPEPSAQFAPTPEEQITPAVAETLPPVSDVSVAAASVGAAPVAAAPAPAPAPAAVEASKPVAIPETPALPAGPNRLVRIFAKPLAGKPRLIRDTAGWLGFNSMFLAGVVWSYHLWFQKPEKPVAQHAPAALVSSDGHGESSHAAAKAESHDAEPGDEARASGEHPTEGGEHANAEKDSDEPITGAQPLHKKKPTYALSDVMAEKLNVAKKAEAGGHGGGSSGHGAEKKKSTSGHGAPPKSGH